MASRCLARRSANAGNADIPGDMPRSARCRQPEIAEGLRDRAAVMIRNDQPVSEQNAARPSAVSCYLRSLRPHDPAKALGDLGLAGQASWTRHIGLDIALPASPSASQRHLGTRI